MPVAVQMIARIRRNGAEIDDTVVSDISRARPARPKTPTVIVFANAGNDKSDARGRARVPAPGQPPTRT